MSEPKWPERLFRCLRNLGAAATVLGILANQGNSSPWLKENGAWIALAGLAAVGISLPTLHFIEKSANDRRPVVTIQATLIDKRERYQPSGNARHLHLRTERYLTFRTLNGKQMTFRVDAAAWYDSREGQKGKLTYQGWRLISFKGS